MVLPRLSLLRILVWIYCLSWCLDYRAETSGGGALHVVSFALSAGSALAIILLGMKQLLVLPGIKKILLWGGFLFSTLIVALYNNVTMGVYLRNTLPPLLMLFSMCVTHIAASSRLSYKDVLWPMLIASAINIVWRVVYTVVFVGKPIEMLRVEILSESMPFVLGWVIATLGLEKKISWPAVGMGLLCMFVYVLSVTRSVIFLLAAEGFATFMAIVICGKMGILPLGFRKAKGRQLMILGVFSAVGAVLLVAFGWFIVERWIERLTHPAGADYLKDDASKLTRYAENVAFYKIMLAHPHSWFIGMGVGHEYYWDESFHPELAYTYGNVDIFRADVRTVTWDGHSLWTYAVFSGGFPSLLVHIIFFFGSLVWAWRSTYKLRTQENFSLPIAFTSFVGQLGYLSLTLTFNPFIERGAMICYGVLITLPQFLAMAPYHRHFPKKLQFQEPPQESHTLFTR